MDVIPIWLHKILSQKATVHIYSFPNFILETFIAAVICVIYCILHAEVTKIGRQTLRLKPNRLFYNDSLKACASKDSFCTSITQIHQEYYKLSGGPSSTTTHVSIKKFKNGSSHSRLGWMMSQKTGDSMASTIVRPYIEDRHNYIDTLLSLTPAEFVKMDKERKMRERELQNCLKSLTTLYDNVMEQKYSEETLNRQLQLARENIECAKMSPEPVKYLGFETEAMTKSLFDLLERIVAKSSLQNPLPFRGDITTLALDVGNLQTGNISSKFDKSESESSDFTNATNITTNTAFTTYTGVSPQCGDYVADEKIIVS